MGPGEAARGDESQRMQESRHDDTGAGAGQDVAAGQGHARRTDLEQFALAVYHAEGVSAACLLLQQRADVDVNLVLFAAFVGTRRGELSSSQLRAAADHVDAWHADVVRPLRSVRQRLKTGPPPAPNDRSAKLRAAVQKLEIDAELIELAELDTFGVTLEVAPAPRGAAANAGAGIAEVVRLRTGRHPNADERAAIARIASAAANLETGAES